MAPPGREQREFLREQMAKLRKRMDERYVQVQLSAPGVSKDGKRAVVYIGVSYAGEFIALRKTDAKWTIEHTGLCGMIS